MRDELKQIEQILERFRIELLDSVPEDQYDVQRAVEYLNEHLFDATCHVSRMKERCKIPQNNFSTRFKHYMGMPPVQYISHHRIEAAKRLLSDEQLKEVQVGEIGFTVGYERVTTFTTIFTRKEGMPPGAWRDRQLKNRRKKRREK